MLLGEYIKKARKEKGLTQAELGKMLGVSGAMIGQWENNIRKPKAESIEKLCKALGRSFNRLFWYESVRNNYSDETITLSYEAMELLMRHNNKISSELQTIIDTRLMKAFNKLNDNGQDEAVKRVEELTEIPRYQEGYQEEDE